MVSKQDCSYYERHQHSIVYKYISTSEVDGTCADKRTSKDVAFVGSNNTGFVIYCAGPEPPVLAVSAIKSGVVPETGLNILISY